MIPSNYQNRFSAESYANGAPCIVALFESSIIEESAIKVQEAILSRLINIGKAYELHLVPLFNIYDDVVLNQVQVKNLLDELSFIESVTNDALLHGTISNFRKLILTCLTMKNCQLIVSGN